MKQQRPPQSLYACTSPTCKSYLTVDNNVSNNDGHKTVFLAVMDCYDDDAISRLREIIPETSVIKMENCEINSAIFHNYPKPEKNGQAELTIRQREILHFLSQGMSNKEIGRRLGISHFTVRNHVSKLLHLLNASSRRQLEARNVAAE